MSERLRVFGAVLLNPTLRRVQAAFLAFSIGEWATWIAIVIYAYGRGGATEAGLVAFVQLVPSLVVAPVIGSIGDRYPRATVLAGTYLIQGGSMAAAAAGLVLDLDPLVVYALAMLTATAVTLTRPVHTALLPEVVDTAEELTAANVTSGTIEGAGTLVGPALAGVLVAIGGPGVAFAASAAALLVSAVLIVPIVMHTSRGTRPMPEPPPGALLSELSAGLATIRGDARLRALAAILGCSWFLLGALDIFYAVLAIEILGLGQSGVGLLGAATGMGMLAGAALAVSLVGRRALGLPLLVAAAACGVAVICIGAEPGALVAGVLLGMAGLGSQYVLIAVQTMTQRIVPDRVLSRVLGVFEAIVVAATALGAIAVPVLVALLGTSGALVAAGATLPFIAALVGRTVLAADRSVVVPSREVALLRAIPIFAPLAAPVLEGLARALTREEHPSGTVVIRQGDPGDRYFVIGAGVVTVEIDGRAVHDQAAGEGFGEIALLRDVPRTATVRAKGPVALYALGREPFLAALTGVPASRRAAEQLVHSRLAGTG